MVLLSNFTPKRWSNRQPESHYVRKPLLKVAEVQGGPQQQSDCKGRATENTFIERFLGKLKRKYIYS